jgi:hypothetical protein
MQLARVLCYYALEQVFERTAVQASIIDQRLRPEAFLHNKRSTLEPK